MRIRSLKPCFWKGQKVRKLSPWARLLLLGLNNYCDDEGRGEWDEVIIKAEIFPEDKVKIGKLLAELVAARSILKYQVEGKTYLAIPNWRDLQCPNRPLPSKLPQFTEDSLINHGGLTEDSLLDRIGLDSKGKDSTGGGETLAKISFREYVNLKQEEYGKLAEQYGKDNAEKMLDKLNAYKGSTGKKYKSDYLAILNWVVKEIMGKGDAYSTILAKVVEKHKPPQHIIATMRTILDIFNRWQPTEVGLGWWFYYMRDLTPQQTGQVQAAICAKSGIEPDRSLLKEMRKDMLRYV